MDQIDATPKCRDCAHVFPTTKGRYVMDEPGDPPSEWFVPWAVTTERPESEGWDDPMNAVHRLRCRAPQGGSFSMCSELRGAAGACGVVAAWFDRRMGGYFSHSPGVDYMPGSAAGSTCVPNGNSGQTCVAQD